MKINYPTEEVAQAIPSVMLNILLYPKAAQGSYITNLNAFDLIY
jgi:hypothetical protein